RVRVVRRDDDEGLAVGLGELDRRLDGLVELDRLTDLATGVGGVVPLVDARALDLEEEALLPRVEEVDGLLGHRSEREGRVPVGVLGAPDRGQVPTTLRGDGPAVAHGEVARSEEAEEGS